MNYPWKLCRIVTLRQVGIVLSRDNIAKILENIFQQFESLGSMDSWWSITVDRTYRDREIEQIFVLKKSCF